MIQCILLECLKISCSEGDINIIGIIKSQNSIMMN